MSTVAISSTRYSLRESGQGTWSPLRRVRQETLKMREAKVIVIATDPANSEVALTTSSWGAAMQVRDKLRYSWKTPGWNFVRMYRVAKQREFRV